ncbi:MAG: DUF2851 family protein [Candidatus Brocadiia bacterium]
MGHQSVGFSGHYRRFLNEFSDQIGEPSARYGQANQNIREEVVRCLWFGAHFSSDDLRTDGNRRVEVLSAGWWNVESGPDFIQAEILLEKEGRLIGDVEVHTVASSWYGHGHHKQPEYNGVVLHVVMWNDCEDRPILRENGTAIPQLVLSDFVEEEIDELVEIIDLEADESNSPPAPGRVRGFCREALQNGEMDPDWLGQFLDCAGDHRILRKAERMEELFNGKSHEQVLYQSLGEALGYKSNRMGFLQLCESAPVPLLREIVPVNTTPQHKREVLDAALYGTAGFLNNEVIENPDNETTRYLNSLQERWNAMPSKLHDNQLSREHWSFGGTRPVNYPTRRLAALSTLYVAYLPAGLFGSVSRTIRSASPEKKRRIDTVIRAALIDMFNSLEHPYWSYRYKFGGKKLSGPRSLVGKQRATAILVDVLIPLCIAHSRQEGDAEMQNRVEAVWNGLPRRSPNTIVRRMSGRLFPNKEQISAVLNSARRQQGLHALYNNFCAADDGCENCVLYLAHQAGEKMIEV